MSNSEPIKVQVRRLVEGARLPSYQSSEAAGVDLEACLIEKEEIVISPMERLLVGTGLAIQIPRGYEAQIRPRSGWALKHGITVLNSPGTIDSDYRGEIKVLLINLGSSPVTIRTGERIAQLVFAPVCQATWEEKDELGVTKRGGGGYGHTGT